ncbi:natural resistance-associated macrophage protein, partial [Testicularia cyperi]
SKLASIKAALKRHIYFVGPGIVAAVAYADPGNWATDLQAGSEYGYSLLFIVLLTGLFAVFIQILACRLGVITETDLARHCRMLILREDRNGVPRQQSIPYPRVRRWALLYPLYIIVEGAIIATELAELTGSAIALNMLFPGLPLWAGILITSVDVVLILFLYRPPPNSSFRILEAFIACLVMVVMSCFIVLLVRTKPYWPDVFHGYLPSHNVVDKGALYVSVGILGATVMPHAIILGSHFASIDRLPCEDDASKGLDDGHATRWTLFSHAIARLFASNVDVRPKQDGGLRGRVNRFMATLRPDPESQVLQHPVLPPRSIRNLKLHIGHASVDIAISLVCFAIFINSAILIVSATVFYYQDGRQGNLIVAGLYDAFELLKSELGTLAGILFAVGLLAAGQSASITCTLAGQLVSEGFINWKTDPFLRRVITRLVAVIPSLTVSIAVGRDGLDEMLVASQVALSIALPFVLLPLIVATGRSSIMVAQEPTASSSSSDQSASTAALHNNAVPNRAAEQLSLTESRQSIPIQTLRSASAPVEDDGLSPSDQKTTPGMERLTGAIPTSPIDQRQAGAEAEASASGLALAEPSRAENPNPKHYFQNWWPVQGLAYAIFAVIVVADVYVLYTTFSEL